MEWSGQRDNVQIELYFDLVQMQWIHFILIHKEKSKQQQQQHRKSTKLYFKMNKIAHKCGHTN